MTKVNRQIVLAARPFGFPEISDFQLAYTSLPTPAEGEVLVRVVYLSLDPYMRGRMNAGDAVSDSIDLGAVMTGGAVGFVLDSADPAFQVGDAVEGMLRGRVLASGPVEEFAMVQSGGFDVGSLRIGSLRSTFVNEYMTAEVDGVPQAVFPDLMMTFAADDGTPLVSAALAVGREVTFLAVDRSELLLSSTMAMDELLAPVEELLGRPLRPAAG